MGFKKSKKKKSSGGDAAAVLKKPVKTILKRKQLRKDKRQLRKTSKKEFYKKKFVSSRTHNDDEDIPSDDDTVEKEVKKDAAKEEATEATIDTAAAEAKRRKEKQQKEQERQQAKQRRRQLKQANEEEGENIARLEKQLGLKRRKSKNLPKSFAEDGLDYLINLDDLGDASSDEEAGDDEELFLKKMKLAADSESDSSDQEGSEGRDSDEEMDNMIEQALKSDESGDEGGEEEVGDDVVAEDSEEGGDDADEEDNEEDGKEEAEEGVVEEEPKEWEDIYGRTRAPDGSVLPRPTPSSEPSSSEPSSSEPSSSEPPTPGRYLPPALRQRPAGPSEEKRAELARLGRQLKGQLNRLAETNMTGILRFVESSYRQHARNDVNQSLTSLVLLSLVLPSLAPARLVMEHVLLVAALHANVGTEVGAHFLQSVVRAFDSSYAATGNVEEAKQTHNLLLIISYVYSFKIVDAKLVFDILDILAESFRPVDIELILLTLRNCGFALRKDDPAALRTFILSVQARAAAAAEEEDGRVTFMLEVLAAIKNNNMAKIPSYDPSHFEHLRVVLRGLVREGAGLTELMVGYRDLANAETAGRWWIVGSAFTGSLAGGEGGPQAAAPAHSNELLELARRMRMNTDTRRNIFCLLMSAEDYTDAAERLVKLGTRNQLEREVMFVVTDCCLQETEYNPYYGHTAARLATADRRYRVAGQFTIWDRLKQAGDLRKGQLSNLARLTAFLVQERVQSLGILKVIEFAEMNKHNVRFLKEVLTRLLLEGRREEVAAIFTAVAAAPALAQFRESVRLFLHHFLLRPGAKLDPQVDRKLLSERVATAETSLLSASAKLKL